VLKLLNSALRLFSPPVVSEEQGGLIVGFASDYPTQSSGKRCIYHFQAWGKDYSLRIGLFFALQSEPGQGIGKISETDK
jgi:hypothetical protein